MLITSNLNFKYENLDLQFPDLECSETEPTLIIGPSGSGKTTLLQLITGLRKPKDGELILDGKDLNALSNQALDKFRGKNIGIVFQQSQFLGSISVMENMSLSRSISGLKPDEKWQRSLLQSMHIEHKSKSKPQQLSVGEQQRFSIAMALVNQPRLIVADEPTSALDDENANAVIDLLIDQAQKAASILIIVTHDQRLKAKISKMVSL